MGDNARRVHFRVARFIHETGMKLQLESIPLATASTLYHLYFKENELKDYDPFMIAMACISLACKIEDQNTNVRDIVNVCYRTLHRSRAPLEMGDLYKGLKESIATWELCLLRALAYRVDFDHPHRYLCHNLKSVGDWINPKTLQEIPVRQTACAFLRDCYFGDLCLKYKPQHMAIAMLYFSLITHGVEVPYSTEAKDEWWTVLSSDISQDIIHEIITNLIELYNLETQLH